MKLDNIDAAILSSRSMPAPARSNSPSGSGSRARRSPDGRRCWRKKVSSVAIRPFWIWRASAFSTTVLVRVTLESKRGGAEIVRSRGHRLSVGGSMLPDVGKRRLHRHCPGTRYRGLRTHSQNRTLAIAAGGADSIELRHARGREPGGPAGDFR